MASKNPDTDFRPTAAKACGVDPSQDCYAVEALAEMLRTCRRIESSVADIQQRMAKGDTNFALIEQWRIQVDADIKALKEAQAGAEKEKSDAMKAVLATIFQWAVFLAGVVGVAATIIMNMKASP